MSPPARLSCKRRAKLLVPMRAASSRNPKIASAPAWNRSRCITIGIWVLFRLPLRQRLLQVPRFLNHWKRIEALGERASAIGSFRANND